MSEKRKFWFEGSEGSKHKREVSGCVNKTFIFLKKISKNPQNPQIC